MTAPSSAQMTSPIAGRANHVPKARASPTKNAPIPSVKGQMELPGNVSTKPAPSAMVAS